MKVTLRGYVKVRMVTDVDTTNEDAAFEEASGRFYDGLTTLIHVPNSDFDWEMDSDLDMEVDECASNHTAC